ncbi:HAD family hydrolase [Pseudomonas sp. HK3]|jgi:HAD superfamily hydrolase (TIGR01549 family)
MESLSLQTFTGVIFDLDGTLVESSLDFPFLRQSLDCPDDMDLLTHVASLDAKSQAHANAFIEQHELDDAQDAKWLPGAFELVSAIAALGLPMAIVTRNSSEAASIKVKNNNIPISTVLTRADAPAKPDPTALLMVAKDWQQSPKTIMYVGDYKYDLQAAINAGMHGCLFAPNETPDYANLAHSICTDYHDLTTYLHKCVTN